MCEACEGGGNLREDGGPTAGQPPPALMCPHLVLVNVSLCCEFVVLRAFCDRSVSLTFQRAAMSLLTPSHLLSGRFCLESLDFLFGSVCVFPGC